MRLILGSQSPRRRELMAGLELPFECLTIDADESYPAHLQGGDIPAYISQAKAKAYMDRLGEDEMLVTADTIVWLNGQVLGKPIDEEDAVRMLRMLSGQTHQVYTGVTFTYQGQMQTLTDRTDVVFRQLDEQEIRCYVSRYRPLDKAGAYGIQEWIGYVGAVRIEGSYFNVMGLPVERVYMHLRPYSLGWRTL